VIKRFYRPQTGTIVIDIEKLSPRAEPVLLMRLDEAGDEDFNPDQVFPGFWG